MEAIKLLNDWSKWIVTLETGAIAGILAWLKPANARPGCGSAGHLWVWGWNIVPTLFLAFAAICFAISIYYAAQLLFSLPDIAEQLPDADEESINEMTGNYMGAGILHYEKRQWWLFVCGLVLAIAGALAKVFTS
jgi:hypothetical protein